MATISTVNGAASGSASVYAAQTNSWVMAGGYVPVSMSFGGLTANAVTATDFAVPDFTPGSIYPAYGAITLTASDNTDTATFNATFVPPASRTFVTLTSVGSGTGYIGNYVVCGIGDQITYDKPATLGVTAHSIGADGLIQTDVLGVFTVYHRNVNTGIISKIDFDTNAGTGILIDLTDAVPNSTSPVFDGAYFSGNRP